MSRGEVGQARDVELQGGRSRLALGEVVLLAALVAVVPLLGVLTRIVILTLHGERFANLPSATVWHAFSVGLRMDASFAALLALPVWVLLFLPRLHWNAGRPVRVAISAWCGAIAFALVLAATADVVHYGEIDARLDATVLDDLRQPTILFEALWNDLRLAGLLLLMGGVGYLAARGVLRLMARLGPRAAAGRARALTGVALLAALFLTARLPGDLAKWWGAAYFSDRYAANQLALNGSYNLALAWYADVSGESSMREWLVTQPEEEALATLREMVVDPCDELLPGAGPLWRRTDTGRPERRLNVVVVMVESLAGRWIGSLGARRTQAPEFDRLAAGGVLFTQHYAAGTRSNRALSAVLSSIPGLPGVSVLRTTRTQGGIQTIGDVLRTRGYGSLVLQAGTRTLDNLDAYAHANGFDRVLGREHFVDPAFETEWGVSDEDLYGRAIEESDALAGTGRPFLLVAMTQSNHRPYRIPEGRVEPSMRNGHVASERDAFRYADWALGGFVEAARVRPWFGDTLFVFVADHGKGRRPVGGPDVASFHIPLLFYAPRHLETLRVAGVGSQIDIAPTIMGVLGGNYEHCFFGSDLLGPRPPQRALMTLSDHVLWLEDGHVLAERPDGAPTLYTYDGRVPTLLASTPETADIRERLFAHLTATAQLAFVLPRTGRHRAPGAD